VVEEFRQFLYREEIPFEEVDFIENNDFIKRFLKREVYVAALRQATYTRRTNPQ
jgi:hypothetical protein